MMPMGIMLVHMNKHDKQLTSEPPRKGGVLRRVTGIKIWLEKEVTALKRRRKLINLKRRLKKE